MYSKEQRREYNKCYYRENREYCLMLKTKQRINMKKIKLTKLKNTLEALDELPFRYASFY